MNASSFSTTKNDERRDRIDSNDAWDESKLSVPPMSVSNSDLGVETEVGRVIVRRLTLTGPYYPDRNDDD